MVKPSKSNLSRVKKRRSNVRHSVRSALTSEQLKQFKTLQSVLNLEFHNEQLIINAFTHSSYVNEHRKKKYEDNERLEFLGDAVLELTVSEFLFEAYPHMSEGELTKLRAAIVCEPALVQFANELSFHKLILLGKGEELTGGRQRPALLADVFEAFVGALYLDQGLQVVVHFLEDHVFPKVNEGAFSHMMDYKSRLQEFIQSKTVGLIEYQITGEKGPAHNREFISTVFLDGKEVGQGAGKSKKEAEQAAAFKALNVLNGQ